MIQTYAPEHYALTCAATHAYRDFFAEEASFRRELGYPPFGWLVNLVLSGNDPQAVERTAQRVAALLRQGGGRVEVLGPAPDFTMDRKQSSK